MGPAGFGPPPDDNDALKPKKPKRISEIPSYLKRLLGGFFYRLFYIFRLVWEAKPSLLFLMIFMAIFNGVSPVISAFISANLLNKLALLFTQTGTYTVGQITDLVDGDVVVLQSAVCTVGCAVAGTNRSVALIASLADDAHIIEPDLSAVLCVALFALCIVECPLFCLQVLSGGK